MAGEKVIRFVFFGMMGAIVAMLFYQIFFQIQIDGHEGGVLVFLSRQAEVPMAQYYYTYSYVPNTVSTQGVDEMLGFSCLDSSNFTSSSNITLDANVGAGGYVGNKDVFANISPSSDIWSTGWTVD